MDDDKAGLPSGILCLLRLPIRPRVAFLHGAEVACCRDRLVQVRWREDPGGPSQQHWLGQVQPRAPRGRGEIGA